MRRRLRWRAALRSLLIVGLALALIALAAPLVALHLAGKPLVWLVIFSTAAALIGGVHAVFVRPFSAWRSADQTARYVGRWEKPVASDLLSSVQLMDHPTETEHSLELVGALVDSTADRITPLRPQALVTNRPLRRPLALFGLVLLMHGLLIALAPQTLANGWSQLMAATRRGPFAGATMSAGPLVGDIHLRLTYPEYTGRDQTLIESSSGDFRALPGTRVTIETTALSPAARARILLADSRDGDDSEEIALAVDGSRLTGEMTVRGDSYYRFLLEAPRGERLVEALPRHIEAETDAAPTVVLYAPAEELDVADLKRIEIAYVAEDDFGLDAIALVVEQGDKPARIPLPLPAGEDLSRAAPRSAQDKYIWDLADVSLQPGARVGYHIEATDNDSVSGAKTGHSRTFYLRVFSPRERHEELMARQRHVVERMLDVLAGRLTVASDDLPARRAIGKSSSELVVELGSLGAALKNDELAAANLIDMVEAARERLDKLARREDKVIARLPDRPGPGQLQQLDKSNGAFVVELENDVILFADWLERQDVENLLAISDEIETSQERLDKLMEEFKRTGSEEVRKEIARELRKLRQRLAQLDERRAQIPSDVLDRAVNTEALETDGLEDCLSQVQELVEAGDIEAAQKRMQECTLKLTENAESLEQALADLRGDKFSEEEQQYQELMNELADLAQDQKDVADEIDEVHERYEQDAAELMKENAESTRKEVGETLSKLRRQLKKIPEAGLTPFAGEELEILETRLDDVEKMLKKGDLAEALAMARQARSSLDILHEELDASLDDQWNRRSKNAERAARKAKPMAKELVEELERATPAPGEILGQRDKSKLAKLRRRQQALRQRANKLAQKTREKGEQLPGTAGEAIGEGLDQAEGHMKRADQRMRANDPSSARHEARQAAEKLGKAQDSARGAARLMQRQGRGGTRDDTVRIPGADEYKPPKKFREEILDAMKKDTPPSAYDDLVRRYYEEIVR